MKNVSIAVRTLLASFVCLTAGCGSGGSASGGGSATPPPPSAGNISGNWQGSLASSSTMSSSIFGSIDQSGGVTSSGQFTTSVFHITSSCFVSNPDIPAQGFVDGSAVTLNSFTVASQNVVLNATAGSTGDTLTGTFSIYGGCADGSKGIFTAQRYDPLTGTFSASFPSAPTSTARLLLTQTTADDGGGGFDMTGTASFSGFNCFNSASITEGTGSRVSGSSFILEMATNEAAGSTVAISGTFNPSATYISNLSYKVTGGACNGQSGIGTGTLAQ